jgi:hypothetical protein
MIAIQDRDAGKEDLSGFYAPINLPASLESPVGVGTAFDIFILENRQLYE